jgi:hypothetical protein
MSNLKVLIFQHHANGHFLEQVLIQKPGAQPRGHNFFKAAHVSNLKNVFSTAFSTH